MCASAASAKSRQRYSLQHAIELIGCTDFHKNCKSYIASWISETILSGMVRTPAGERWRLMQDAARGQALRLGDPGWEAGGDPYAGRVDSFRAGQRTDENVVQFLAAAIGPDATVLEVGAGAGRLCLPLARHVRAVVAL